MTLVGMLHHRLNPEKVRKAYAYASVAKSEGVDFVYFTAGRVNLDNRTVLGKVYENGQWLEKTVRLPDVIFNASPGMGERAEEIEDQLRERIPFTSHSIGDKLNVYERIKKGGEFNDYLIPTEEMVSTEIFFSFIEQYSKIIIKPRSGSRGIGFLYIEKVQDRFIVKDQDQTQQYSQTDIEHLIANRIDETDYLIQAHISSCVQAGNVYDFRLHVQKNDEGKWVVGAMFPRIGYDGKMTSNMASGGSSGYVDVFFDREFGEHAYDIQQYLAYFAISFANHFQSLYDVEFDELGVDVGIDENEKIWLFEVNWRPGPPVVCHLELDVPKNTIRYAKYLASQHQAPEPVREDKTRTRKTSSIQVTKPWVFPINKK